MTDPLFAAPDSPSRRIVLKGLGAMGLSLALSGTALAAIAADSDGKAFARVSRFLTERDALPADLSSALLVALRTFDPGFAAKLARFDEYIETHQLTAGAPLDLGSDPAASAFAELPRLILTGWYLGIAGSGAGAICVIYADALAYQNTADKLRPPSYAYGVYGSWAAKPV